MNTARVNAYAKLNLTLDIVGVRDGYHVLDSAVVTIDLYDRIVAKKRKDALVTVAMHGMGSEGIPFEENNAARAAEKFVTRFGTTGADLTIYKNIPLGAGLGGSSADAAGAINALAKLYKIEDKAALKEVADSCGSDTGFLLSGGFARIRGRGDLVENLGTPPVLHALLLVPRGGVSTAECFSRYDARGETFPPRTEKFLEAIPFGTDRAGRFLGNALYPAARELNPAVGEALLEAKEFSPLGAAMTGSGSGVFALFETAELVAWAKSRYRGKCRTYQIKSVDPAKKRGFRNPFALGGGEE